jgi:TolB-like protein/DNA-binding SARP family transcriptional activator/Tfp pilus assembly protein PilF
MINLYVLGTLDLQGPHGRHLGSPLVGSKRLAVLAYLALSAHRGLSRRDTLLGLFWPERPEKHARNSLSNMLHQIRRSLGRDVVVTRGHEEVGVAEASLWCDAVAFLGAVKRGELEKALDLYRGDLLDGFFAPNASAEFDHWLDAERTRLRRLAAEAADSLSERAEREDVLPEAIRWARRSIAIEPFNESTVRRLVLLLDGVGNRADALQTYDDLKRRLAITFEIEPAAELRDAIERIRQRSESSAGHEPLPTSSVTRRGTLRSERPLGFADLRTRNGERPSNRSVAVLPFDNLSGTDDAEPFVAGLHDDLLTELSRISALSVTARTSVSHYRSSDKPLQQIARELGVGTIIEGAVQSDGTRLRLNVQMIDAGTGAHRWAERYDRELSTASLFDLQTELAERIAGSLNAELTAAERERPAREPPDNLEAYRSYVQGRTLLDQRTRSGMHRSLEHFQRAVELAPGYALAWAGLADALSLLRDYEYEPAELVLPQANRAVQQALELDPCLAEAHTALGEYHVARRDGPAAVEALRRALELRSNYAEAHNWLGWMSQVLGDRQQALASAKNAAELDPLSPEVISNLSLSYLTNGNTTQALREARRVRHLQPDWTTGPFYEALSLYHMGRYSEAISILEDLTVEWAGSGPKLTYTLALANSGETDRARSLLTELEAASDLFAAGVIRLALGETERGVETLLTVSKWDYWSTLAMHHCYPNVLGPFRSDARCSRIWHAIEQAWGPKA